MLKAGLRILTIIEMLYVINQNAAKYYQYIDKNNYG